MDVGKAYRPATQSLSSGQVLQCAYTFDKALTVVMEMADSLALDLVEKDLVTAQLTLTVGYDSENLANPAICSRYTGRITTDHFGRPTPYHAHGTMNFDRNTSSSRLIRRYAEALFRRIADPLLLVRRLTLSANRLQPDGVAAACPQAVQLELFTDYEKLSRRRNAEAVEFARERRRQDAIISLRHRFGKNAVLSGLNYAEGATQIERNKQIGGHRAW